MQRVSSCQIDLQTHFQWKIPASCFLSISSLILKFIWRGKRPRIASKILKEKNKVRVCSNYLTSRLTLKLCFLSLILEHNCGIVEKLTNINETEWRAQKQTHINMVNWCLTKKMQNSGAKIIFLTNGVITRHPYAKKKEEICTQTLNSIWKLTPSES